MGLDGQIKRSARFTEHLGSLLGNPENKRFKMSEILKQAIILSYRDILAINQQLSTRSHTTLSGFLLMERKGNLKACIFNVGDSRTYLYRESLLSQLTKDHSFIDEEIEQGRLTEQQAAIDPRRNDITRSVGYEDNMEADIFFLYAKEGRFTIFVY